MSFSDYWQQLEWQQLQQGIYEASSRDVERALGSNKLTLENFAALLSPAADSYLPQMAERAASLTRQRFGKTIQFYLPLYLSNLCANDCSYCGFSMSNRLKRRTLTPEEIERECLAIKQMGFDSVLLVTGEHEAKVGMNYFHSVLPIIKRHFNYLMMEVQPLAQEEYRELVSLGLDAVMVYQETYHQPTYASHHLRGKKQDFHWRLQTPDRLARAGVDKIGLGALIGLDDWRTDSLFVAHHLRYLEQNYWQSRYSISFPRLRPCAGNTRQQGLMRDRELVQLISAYRLLSPQVELSLSTREPAWLRDKLIPLGITSMSAGSSTSPGGYATATEALEQFSIDDNRSPSEVQAMIQAQGFEVVWKDWERSYSG
ncbi:2-iminoacetate synthase ThiH [Dongshaea marina]|uniref:2-iminoacetate synthase ThiH n=1 Tax=Dongshaea marina TaxID=2047966 RepID=UPI000D3E29CA|nr:2-iminoacetate synthase ThiH [Dongshaea marina]